VRIALVIMALAAVAVGMIYIRRAETRANHEVYRLQLIQVHLRCRVYDQQAELGRLTAPKDVRQRAEKMDVGLTWFNSGEPTVVERAPVRKRR
jgi:hypothetical protein